MIDDLTDTATDGVNSNPYQAYKNYVNQVYRDMKGGPLDLQIPVLFILIAAVVVTGIFYLAHGINKKGAKTTLATTYVNGGKPVMNSKQDVLYDKRVVSRKIETSSGGSGGGRSSGGGGHHTSSGGHSHGGGGGRH